MVPFTCGANLPIVHIQHEVSAVNLVAVGQRILHEFTSRGELSVSQSYKYPAKRGVRPNPLKPPWVRAC